MRPLQLHVTDPPAAMSTDAGVKLNPLIATPTLDG
jgi:hypothetical protein